MIKPLLSYCCASIRPRIWRILLQPQVALAMGIGILIFNLGPGLPMARVKVGDISIMVLTYAAIAFGFCIAGMALVLTLPSTEFLKSLQKHKLDGSTQSSYLDLLFVFSWTAVCHWLLVVFGITAILMRGDVPTLFSYSDPACWKVFVSTLFGLCSYTLIQFLMTVITLTQVGDLYSRELSKIASGNS
jgi:hypothetical protein